MSETRRSKGWSRIAGAVAASSLAILSTIAVASPASATSETGSFAALFVRRRRRA